MAQLECFICFLLKHNPPPMRPTLSGIMCCLQTYLYLPFYLSSFALSLLLVFRWAAHRCCLAFGCVAPP